MVFLMLYVCFICYAGFGCALFCCGQGECRKAKFSECKDILVRSDTLRRFIERNLRKLNECGVIQCVM